MAMGKASSKLMLDEASMLSALLDATQNTINENAFKRKVNLFIYIQIEVIMIYLLNKNSPEKMIDIFVSFLKFQIIRMILFFLNL